MTGTITEVPDQPDTADVVRAIAEEAMTGTARQALSDTARKRAREALGRTYHEAFQRAKGTVDDPYDAHVEALDEGLEAALIAFMGWDQ